MVKPIIAILLIGIFISCNTKNENQNETISTEETPPSVSGVTEDVRIKLTDKELKELEIQTYTIEESRQRFFVNAPGLVFPAPEYVSIISTPIDGRISSINASEGNYVSKGQELFTIESLEFGNLVAEYLQAIAEEKFQSSRLTRLQQLVEQSISSRSELDRSQSDYQRASAAVIASYSKLKAIGVPTSEIDAFKNATEIDPTLKIHSPISGIVDQRLVDLGQAVNALQKLGRVINTSKVMIKGYLSPEDAIHIHKGNMVDITLRDKNDQVIYSKISSVNPGLDETNRSVVVNILVNTENGWPKPGENVRLEIKSDKMSASIAIPIKALSYDGDNPVVYVQTSTTSFEKRIIEIKEINQQEVYVAKGLNVGEKIAVTQVFSLKALSRYSLIAE